MSSSMSASSVPLPTPRRRSAATHHASATTRHVKYNRGRQQEHEQRAEGMSTQQNETQQKKIYAKTPALLTNTRAQPLVATLEQDTMAPSRLQNNSVAVTRYRAKSSLPPSTARQLWNTACTAHSYKDRAARGYATHWRHDTPGNTAQHSTTQNSTTRHYTLQHSTTSQCLHSTAHRTAQHSTTQHSTQQSRPPQTVLHNTALISLALNDTALH